MFYKRDKKGSGINAKVSAQYDMIHKQNKNWMDQSGKESAFTAYNATRHIASKAVSSSKNNNVFEKKNNFTKTVKATSNEINNNLKETKDTFKGSFKMLKDSLKDTVKTGKIYSKEREDEASKKGMKGFGLDLDEMSFEDFDFGEDEEGEDIFGAQSDEDSSEDKEPKKKKTRRKLIKNETNLINKSGLTPREAEILSNSVVSATNSIIKINMAGFMKIADTYNYMNNTAAGAHSSIIENFNRVSNTMDDILRKKILTTVSNSRNVSSLSDLTKINFVTAKSFTGFLEGVRDAVSTFNMFASPMLYAVAANPIAYGLKSLMAKGMQNNKHFGKFRRLNDRLSNLPMETYMNLKDGVNIKDMINKNGRVGRFLDKRGILDKLDNEKILRLIDGKLFKGSKIFDSLKDYDTTARVDKQTAVAFDAETQNSINVVIPGYLAKIYSTLTGKKIYHDYDTGTWNDGKKSKKIQEIRRGKFLEDNHIDLARMFKSKFKENTSDLMKRVIDDNILSLDDLKSKEDNYTKEEYDELRRLLKEDLDSFRVAVRKGALVNSAYYKNSTLSPSEKNLYNNLFKDDDDIYKTGEEKELKRLNLKLIYSGKLIKKKIKELDEAKSSLSEMQEEKARKEKEESKAETPTGKDKDSKDKKEDKKGKKDSSKDNTKEEKKNLSESERKAKKSSKEVAETVKEAQDKSSDNPFDIFRDIKDGAKALKNSKWGKRLAESKLGKGFSKLKGKLSSGTGTLGRFGKILGKGKRGLGKVFGKIAGKAGTLSTIYDVLNGDGDITDVAELGMDAYDSIKNRTNAKSFKDLGKNIKGGVGETLAKGKNIVSEARAGGGFFGKVKGFLSGSGETLNGAGAKLGSGIGKIGASVGNAAKGLGETLTNLGSKFLGKGLGKGVLKGGFRAAARTGLKAAGPIGWGVSLLLAGPEIVETVKHPWESLKDPLGTIGSLFGFNDHPAKRNAEARARGEEPESITKKVFTAPLKWLGIMDDDKDKKKEGNVAKAADENSDKAKEAMDKLNEGNTDDESKAEGSKGGFLSSIGNFFYKATGAGIVGSLLGIKNPFESDSNIDLNEGKETTEEDEAKNEKLNSVFGTLWKLTPMGMAGIKPPTFGSKARSSKMDDADKEGGAKQPDWLNSRAESTGEYGNVANGQSTGDLSSEMGEQKVDTASQAVLSDPGLVVKNLLMMSPLGMFMGLGKQKTEAIFKSNAMQLAEKDPKQFARVMFANTTLGSMYNLAQPSNLALSALSTGMLNIFAPLDEFTDNQDVMRDTTNFKGEKGTTLSIRDMNGDTKSSSGGGGSSATSSSGGKDGKEKEGASTAKPTGEATKNQTAGSSTKKTENAASPAANPPKSSTAGEYTGEKFERPPLPNFEKQANSVIGNDVNKMDKIAKKIFEIQNRPDPRKDKILKAVKDLTKKMIDESKASADPLTGYDYEAYLILKDILEVVENIGANVVNINKSFDTVTTKLKTKTTKIIKNNSIRKVINKTIEDKITEQAAHA